MNIQEILKIAQKRHKEAYIWGCPTNVENGHLMDQQTIYLCGTRAKNKKTGEYFGFYKYLTYNGLYFLLSCNNDVTYKKVASFNNLQELKNIMKDDPLEMKIEFEGGKARFINN